MRVGVSSGPSGRKRACGLGEEADLAEAAIVIEGVTKRFREKVAVRDLDLVIPSGSLCGFLGPNGAGKTTTIRMIMSIFYPDSGSIRVLGKSSAVESKDRIGYLPEERGVYRKMKVGEFLVYMGRLKGLAGGGLWKRVDGWLERMGLGDVRGKKCEELSKGMQQKAQFIAAIIHEPELLILDEPFSGLDPVNRRLLRTLIEEQQKAGRTIVFSTHAMFEAEQLCDQLFMIHKGVKVLDSSVEEVWAAHDPRAVVVEPMDRNGEAGGGEALGRIAGVAEVIGGMGASGRQYEVRLMEGTEPGAVIRAITGAMAVRSIQVKQPSLEDVFIGLVDGAGEIKGEGEVAGA